MRVYEHFFRSAGGVSMPMERWRGQPVLIVNTASESQWAAQLTGLQALYEEFMPSGLVVIAMPSNDFQDREPLEGEELEAQYRERFGVNFPVTEKVSINGRYADRFFIMLREEYTSEVLPTGNFFKYLFGRDGVLIEHWPGDVPPESVSFRATLQRNALTGCCL